MAKKLQTKCLENVLPASQHTNGDLSTICLSFYWLILMTFHELYVMKLKDHNPKMQSTIPWSHHYQYRPDVPFPSCSMFLWWKEQEKMNWDSCSGLGYAMDWMEDSRYRQR